MTMYFSLFSRHVILIYVASYYVFIICGLSGSVISLVIVSQTARFPEKMCLIPNVCHDFLCKFYQKTTPVIQLDTITNIRRSSRKVSVIFVRF
jgi:hypothetical protein